MTHEKTAPRYLVSLPKLTKAMLEAQLARVNKARAKLNKTPLTRGDYIALAIENLTVEQGVSR